MEACGAVMSDNGESGGECWRLELLVVYLGDAVVLLVGSTAVEDAEFPQETFDDSGV